MTAGPGSRATSPRRHTFWRRPAHATSPDRPCTSTAAPTPPDDEPHRTTYPDRRRTTRGAVMAIIHRTTLTPGKLELLAEWLPDQPWYRRGGGPGLAQAGGFRLDAPAGEVGIEFMVVTDGSGDSAVSYLTPLTYRASALAGADGALVGTTEHGVLGRRWVYDGIADPILVGQLVALLQGRVQPQAQSVSDTADPTVTCVPVADGIPLAG